MNVEALVFSASDSPTALLLLQSRWCCGARHAAARRLARCRKGTERLASIKSSEAGLWGAAV